MRQETVFPLFFLLLSACQGAAPDPAPPAANHAAMVAGMQNQFMWDCTLTSQQGLPDRRFVLDKQSEGRWYRVLLVEAGRDHAEQVVEGKDEAARTYAFKDGSRILVASDGEIFPQDAPQTSRAHGYNSGHCNKGAEL